MKRRMSRQTYEEYCVARIRQAIVRAHGRRAYEEFRDVIDHLARRFANPDDPRQEDRLAWLAAQWIAMLELEKEGC